MRRFANVLQCPFAEHIGIALSVLSQSNEFVGDGVLDMVVESSALMAAQTERYKVGRIFHLDASAPEGRCGCGRSAMSRMKTVR